MRYRRGRKRADSTLKLYKRIDILPIVTKARGLWRGQFLFTSTAAITHSFITNAPYYVATGNTINPYGYNQLASKYFNQTTFCCGIHVKFYNLDKQMDADPTATYVYIRHSSNGVPGNLVLIQPMWARVVLAKPTLAFDQTVPAAPVVYVSRPTTAEYHTFINVRDVMGGKGVEIADDDNYATTTTNTAQPIRRSSMTFYIVRSDNNALSVKVRADVTLVYHSVFYFPKDPGLVEAYPDGVDPDPLVDEFSNNITITTSNYPS